MTNARSRLGAGRVGVAAAALLTCVGASRSAAAAGRPFLDYLRPAPVVCAPLGSGSWGVADVLPRDLCNGIESARGAGVPPEYYYWDGQIIKARDGKYHMFMSTWSGSAGFNPGWTGSDAFHAISTQGALGPYERQGYVYTDNGSHKGHNVSALELPDGTYAVVVSETVPFTIYTSSSLDGPWTGCKPAIRANGVNAGTDGHYDSNVSLVARHDGRFEIVQRHGLIAIADTLCGPYDMQKPTWAYPEASWPSIDSIYPRRTSIPGVSDPTFAWEEDPHLWLSGGVYHVLYSGSGDRVGWHLYSPDGINDWQDGGLAFSPREYDKIFAYEGLETRTKWYKMERPGVVLEDGHPTYITWAVADVDKDYQIPAGSNHGSKVIVVPFDGAAFDADYGTGSGGTGGTGGAGGAGGAGGPGGGAATCPGSASQAYRGAPASAPGLVEAEDFDETGYLDSTPGNEGGEYRPDVDVDLKAVNGGYGVGWMTAGEWLEYTLAVSTAGEYRATFQVGAVEPGRTLVVSACGTQQATLEVPQVAAWGELSSVSTTLVLGAGLQVLRVEVGAQDFLDFDSVKLELVSVAAGGAGGDSPGVTGGDAASSGGASGHSAASGGATGHSAASSGAAVATGGSTVEGAGSSAAGASIDSGCGCNVAGEARWGWGVGALGIAGLLLRRRRNERTQPHRSI